MASLRRTENSGARSRRKWPTPRTRLHSTKGEVSFPAGDLTSGSRTPPLILGSASPRRRRLLREAGIPFRAVVPEVDEVMDPRRPQWTARQNALRKMAWCRQRWPDARILTADTIIAFNGRGVGKPRTRAEAISLLQRLSGRTHCVWTAVAYAEPAKPVRCCLVTTRVRFRNLSPAAIRAYLRSVDPRDKAGGYNIEEHGELLIAAVHGSRSNVAGLPMEVVLRWLKAPSPNTERAKARRASTLEHRPKATQ